MPGSTNQLDYLQKILPGFAYLLFLPVRSGRSQSGAELLLVHIYELPVKTKWMDPQVRVHLTRAWTFCQSICNFHIVSCIQFVNAIMAAAPCSLQHQQLNRNRRWLLPNTFSNWYMTLRSMLHAATVSKLSYSVCLTGDLRREQHVLKRLSTQRTLASVDTDTRRMTEASA